MTKPAGRKGDIGSNHGAWHPSPITSGSPNVLINGKPAARQGDSLAPHVKPKSSPHGRSIAAGSSSVLINGRPAARVGDAIGCGGKIITGSSNVFIGDNPTFLEPEIFSLPDIDFATQQGNKPHTTIFSDQANTMMGAHDEVKIDIDTQAHQEAPPEYKNVNIRLDIDPQQSAHLTDKFILSSTDGSYRVVKTVKDDLIPGDGYLDLQYTNLDTSKLYTLEIDDGEDIDTVLYAYNYESLSGFMPTPDEGTPEPKG